MLMRLMKAFISLDTSMADAEGYIEIPANVDRVEKGEPVIVKFF
jgi:hypothetical protein